MGRAFSHQPSAIGKIFLARPGGVDPRSKTQRRKPDEACANGVALPDDCRPTAETYLPKYFAFRSVNAFHFSGRSSRAKIAETGQTGTQAPQSMHSTGSIYNISSVAYFSESFLG